jgi:hypothetical protein
MATKIRNNRLFFKLSRRIGLRLTVILTFGLLSVSGNPLKAVDGRQPVERMEHELAAPAQKWDRRAAQKKFEEGEEFRNQGTAESLRQALKKYEEALLLWRDIGDLNGIAKAAELVTPSACQTGLGKLTRGEGLVSLTRGFMYAGAARVVVSLWSVSDKVTSELMVKFYRRMLIDGERPAAWRDKRWETPFYWAAFTLQGEWRSQ